MSDTPNALKHLHRLEDLCEPYLGMTFVVARRHFANGTLPVKAFRLASSRRGPIFVHEDELTKLVRRRMTKAVAAPAPAAAHPNQLNLELPDVSQEKPDAAAASQPVQGQQEPVEEVV